MSCIRAEPEFRCKKPDWDRTYTFDFSGYEELAAGDTLSNPAVTVTGADGSEVPSGSGLTYGAPTVSGSAVLVRVGSKANPDTPGEYRVKVGADTSSGAHLTVTGTIIVEEDG